MQQEKRLLKYTTTNKVLFFFLLFTCNLVFTQVIVIDSTNVIKDEVIVKLPDSVNTFKKFKAEGVTAVIGDYVVLDSDIDKSYLQMQQQGASIENVTRCQLLGKLMEDKLYAHQAIIDSLPVSDNEINGQTDQQIAYLLNQFAGDEDKMLAFYKKDNLTELRSELFLTNKEMMLAKRMQQKIFSEVEVTPAEVRQFFFSIPEDERPVFSAEVEIAQIVMEPQITEASKQKVIDRLNVFRQDILENGASFATKAVLYSKDGSAAKGGLIEGIRKNSPFAKEFKDVGFSLNEGEVSEPFETSFGFHILTVDKIRGQEIDVRHIILFPEVTQQQIDQARKKIDSIRTEILNGNITFKDAAMRYSTEKETSANGGQLVNPESFDTRFDLTKMDPEFGAQVYNLEKGEITSILTERDYTGKSKFKILTVTNRYSEHEADFKEDYEKIKELALKQKQIKAISKWQDETIKDTYVNVNSDYNNCEFANNWLKN